MIILQELNRKLGIPSNLPTLDKLAIIAIASTPMGYYLHTSWLSNFYALSSLLCIISLIIYNKPLSLNREEKFICLIFIAYPLAIFLSQLFRWEWQLKAYHDQSRFLLALPIFLFLLKRKINLTKLLSITVPTTVLIGWVSVNFLHQTNYWGERQSLSFIDPLAFGLMNVTLSLICFSLLITFTGFKKSRWLLTLLLSIGVSLGIYQSILSQSRTGWLALLAIPSILIVIKYRTSWLKSTYLIISIFAILFSISYYYSDIFNKRILEAYHDVVNYPWSGKLDHEASFGWRITFWRIGWFYFTQSPIFGWGDKGFSQLIESPHITVFATKEAIEYCLVSLFHNEWVTQAVRYGLLGIASTAFVFYMSFKTFWKYRYTHDNLSSPALIGITLIICCFIAGLSNEIFNLKHLVTVNAYFLACTLSATLIYNQAPNQQTWDNF